MKHLLASCALLSIAALSSAAATLISATKAETVTVTFATFFLNHSESFAANEMPKIKEFGCRFGNHSWSHPFLMESGVNRIFREIVANKVWIESASDMPCTTFAMPYNWGCQLEPARAAKLAKILVDSGTFVSSNGPVSEGEQPPEEWFAGHHFNIGTDDAHYGAYRYEFWHSKIAKTSVKGNVATFEVTRHDPAFLGAVQDLTYTFGGIQPVKVESHGDPAPDSAPCTWKWRFEKQP